MMMEEDQDNAMQEVLEIDVKSLECSVQLTCSVVLIDQSMLSWTDYNSPLKVQGTKNHPLACV